jgi:hypothetical protein
MIHILKYFCQFVKTIYLCRICKWKYDRTWPFHQLAFLSTCQFVNLPFCQLAILSTCHFVNLPFHQLAILSICNFVNLPFCQLAILSTCHFVNLQFCQLAILSTCYYCQLTISSTWHFFSPHKILMIGTSQGQPNSLTQKH